MIDIDNTQREHLKINETVLAEPAPKYIQQEPQPKEEIDLVTLLSTNWLWIFSSWSIILINIITSVISIRDMLSTNYVPMTHWYMSGIFVITIGTLMLIHQFIIKRN